MKYIICLALIMLFLAGCQTPANLAVTESCTDTVHDSVTAKLANHVQILYLKQTKARKLPLQILKPQ